MYTKTTSQIFKEQKEQLLKLQKDWKINPCTDYEGYLQRARGTDHIYDFWLKHKNYDRFYSSC